MPTQNHGDFIKIDIAALHFVNDIEHHPTGVIDESVPVPAAMLLTLEVYPILQTGCQPRADGFSVIVPAIHDALLLLLIDYLADSTNLAVYFILQPTAGSENLVVARLEVRLLCSAHFRDQIEELSCVHILFLSLALQGCK